MNPKFETRDTSSKANSLRSARASAILKVSPGTIEAIRAGTTPKADPLSVAKVAAIQSAKQTSTLIPYCHPIPLTYAGVELELRPDQIVAVSDVKAVWNTGVEMEAIVAAATAVVTLYDMLKAIDDTMEIVSVRLVEKKGGKSSVQGPGAGLKAAVIVLSDSVSKGMSEDRSGKLILQRLQDFHIQVPQFKIMPDDGPALQTELRKFSDSGEIDLIITSGGTGLGPRDITPEATQAVIDRRLEGVEEAFRSFGQDRTRTAMLSRGVVGVRGSTIIVNLPGSPSAVEDGFNALFPTILHAFRMMKGDRH
ncbi:MAG TPA: bifunctional molybdenum cofactor biosynthesis protein MoaC/MoaB [Bacteroidota bacterium]|nr:bifunctional molybdenum cofactor biosynthesis protein MoaC/MoaB [Bacteroidota bacterium]